MIPKTAHFVWIGKTFPWVYGLALRSAELRGGFSRIVLHHTDDLQGTPGWRLLSTGVAFESRRLEPRELLYRIDGLGRELAALYGRLSQPAARSNLLRVAILALEGGVYLDTDVVTIRTFEPLLQSGMFCGTERIALPAQLMRSRLPHRWLAALARLGVRDLLRRVPSGWRLFRRIEHLYPAVVNNAVLGGTAGHPFLLEMLDRMIQMHPQKQMVRFALGTHLLEEMVAAYQQPDLEIHPPSRFYPLGPEISAHWFYPKSHPITAKDIVYGDTVCAHWYASVRTRQYLPIIDERFVSKNAQSQYFSSLVETGVTGDALF